MIMFWNRREVFVGSSMDKFCKVRDILSSNKMKYDYKVVNHSNASGRSNRGAIGINMNYANLYYVYVHYKDYQQACSLLNRNQ